MQGAHQVAEKFSSTTRPARSARRSFCPSKVVSSKDRAGSPTAGMGFRINIENGRMGLDMVWATIAVAAVAGSAFYGILALLERAFTFWHPSYRAQN